MQANGFLDKIHDGILQLSAIPAVAAKTTAAL
jgi:hypothetical protein